MFKFCNRCFLCEKYYNDNAEFKNYGYYQNMLPKFINTDYDVNKSNEILTEEYIFTSGDKGLPEWYLYEDEFIYACSGSILKGIEGSTSSWNGESSNNLSSYFITNYGKLIYIDLSCNRNNIYIKYPNCSINKIYADIILNKTKINQYTLNNINMCYEWPGLLIHKDNNQKFNIDIIYSIIHTYKSSQNDENLDILHDKYIDLKHQFNSLKDKYSYLHNLYKQNLDKLKFLDNKHNNINIDISNNTNNSGKMAMLRKKVKINKKTVDNNNIFLNPRTWD